MYKILWFEKVKLTFEVNLQKKIFLGFTKNI